MITILVDMDGVLADLEATFWPLFADANPTAPVQRDRSSFYIEDQIGYEWEPEVERVMRTEGFFESLVPVENAVEGFDKLRAEHDVWICTAPVTSPYCMAEKWRWIERYFGVEQTSKMIIAKDKTMIRGDFLIDDRPEVTGNVEPSWVQIYYDQPYNRSTVDTGRLTWDQILSEEVGFSEMFLVPSFYTGNVKGIGHVETAA